jgi:hypothetical protein
METAVPGQIKHACRQSGLSEIRTELQVSGDISSNGTVWSQNEACLTGIQAYTKTEVNNALALKAPLASPALTGTATAVNLTVSGTLLAGTTNVLTTLNSKANTSDVYTRTQIENALQPKIASFVAPLKYTENILTGINTLSIDATVPFPTGDIECSGTLSVDTIETRFSDTIQINDNVTITGELVVAGNNMVQMLNPYWVAVVIGFSGGNPYFIRNGGRYAATALTRMSGQATGVVQFDFPAHPQGINYLHHFGGLSCFGAAVALNKSNTRLGVVIRSDSTIATVDREVHVFIPAY